MSRQRLSTGLCTVPLLGLRLLAPRRLSRSSGLPAGRLPALAYPVDDRLHPLPRTSPERHVHLAILRDRSEDAVSSMFVFERNRQPSAPVTRAITNDQSRYVERTGRVRWIHAAASIDNTGVVAYGRQGEHDRQRCERVETTPHSCNDLRPVAIRHLGNDLVGNDVDWLNAAQHQCLATRATSAASMPAVH